MCENLQQFIKACENLCENLSHMADNERKFGWDLCHRIEQLSYEIYKNSQELRELNSCIMEQAI